MKQIVLVTDGCSNVGMDPVAAAAAARAENITVNVVGIVDRDGIGGRGEREIEEIARAGGGMSRIVPAQQLSQTVQMMTRKTVTHTIHQVVNRELRQILSSEEREADSHVSHSRTGHLRTDLSRTGASRTSRVSRTALSESSSPATLESLHPEKRAEVVRVIEDLSEKSSLYVALLIDTSASMRPKLAAVRETVRDLMLSLNAREGHSELSVFRFPGNRDDAALELDWTVDLEKTNDLFYKLNMKGTTPTGPAIMRVVEYFVNGLKTDSGPESDAESFMEDEPSVAR